MSGNYTYISVPDEIPNFGTEVAIAPGTNYEPDLKDLKVGELTRHGIYDYGQSGNRSSTTHELRSMSRIKSDTYKEYVQEVIDVYEQKALVYDDVLDAQAQEVYNENFVDLTRDEKIDVFLDIHKRYLSNEAADQVE